MVESFESLVSPEVEKKEPTVIGVIGPHAIGKDTVIQALKEELAGNVHVFSIGRYLEENLIGKSGDGPEDKRKKERCLSKR